MTDEKVGPGELSKIAIAKGEKPPKRPRNRRVAPPSYYEDDDDNFIYACCGPHIFRTWTASRGTWLDRDPSEVWTFLVPISPANEAASKRIWNHRVSPLSAEQIAALPPVPAIPDYTPVDWEDAFEPKAPMLCSDYPHVAHYLKCVGSWDIHFVLYEDTYETMFGDGAYYYLREVFLQESEADDYCKASPESTFHRRSARIHMRDDQLFLDGANRQRDDQWTSEKVFEALEHDLDPDATPFDPARWR